MKISYSWLKKYCSIDEPVQAVEEALTLIGFEVEGVEQKGVPPLEHVVVGEVLERNPHPNADRLSVCQVRYSESEEPTTIVCGAQNYKVGDRVPVALPGAVLPGNFTIKKSKLRGVASHGMMCSARELNCGEDHSGLMILEEQPPIGTPIHEVLPEPDTIFDVEVTPNRPDCLSVLGIARELTAYFRADLKYPEIRHAVRLPEGKASLLDKVEVLEGEACPYYTAWSISKVRVGESPTWLKTYLKSAGLRPINNVVDITNYIMLETGQPLHAFDSSKIKSDVLRIRSATAGEKMVTLDGKERALREGDLVIADGERPLVIAGIMGSVDAEVDETTTDIVLEAAYFEPSGVRSTARRLALSTDSSYRFERGVDPHGIEYAASRCVDLILDLCAGEALGEPISVGGLPEWESEIEIHPDYVRTKIGFPIEDDEIRGAWERLEMDVDTPNDEDRGWIVRIPTFRGDLTRPIDLVEECLRMYGTDRIPTAEVRGGALSSASDSVTEDIARKARGYLVSNGFYEAYNYSLCKDQSVRLWQGEASQAALKLKNPLAQDQTHLRPTLLGGLLEVVHYNLSRSRKEYRFFELGRVFKEQDGVVRECFSIAFAAAPSVEKETWKEGEMVDFFSAKNWISNLLALILGPDIDVALEKCQCKRAWADSRSAQASNDKYECTLGYLSREALTFYNLKVPVLVGEILLLDPQAIPSLQAMQYQPVSSYPPMIKDIAVLVDSNVSAGDVAKKIHSYASGEATGFEVADVRIFDVYHDGESYQKRKSLAFTVTYASAERTLNEKEVGKAFDGLQKRIQKDPSLQMRDS